MSLDYENEEVWECLCDIGTLVSLKESKKNELKTKIRSRLKNMKVNGIEVTGLYERLDAALDRWNSLYFDTDKKMGLVDSSYKAEYLRGKSI